MGAMFMFGLILGFCIAGGCAYAIWRYVLPKLSK